MNNHEINIRQTCAAFCRVSDINLCKCQYSKLGVTADTRLYTEDEIWAAIEADRKRRCELTAAEISDVIREITGCPDIKNGEDSLVVTLGMLFHRYATTKSSEPVAYLDLGAGGYMDVGTDLTDEQLAALSKGRHMLGIIGTYGVDGYTPAEPMTHQGYQPIQSGSLPPPPAPKATQPAEPVKLECPKCDADRSKVPCAGELMNCHFKGEAQSAANVIPVVQEPAVPSDEEILGIAEDHLRVEDVPEYGSVVGGVINFARALLARAAIEADRKHKQSEAEEVCGEAYQVVGSLLSDLGIFETDHAKKILDNLSQAKMVHKDVLPWPSFDRKHRGEPVGEVLGETCIDGGKCHHRCKERCFRRQCCEPFSDYSGPWKYAAETVKASDDLAHEIWAAAQTVPGEGIEDAVDRVTAILTRYDQPAVPKLVGEAEPLPGADGFTMACFKAEDVPVGTKLYTVSQTLNIDKPVSNETYEVLAGWAVGLYGGGFLHAANYTEDQAHRAGYSLPLYYLKKSEHK